MTPLPNPLRRSRPQERKSWCLQFSYCFSSVSLFRLTIRWKNVAGRRQQSSFAFISDSTERCLCACKTSSREEYVCWCKIVSRGATQQSFSRGETAPRFKPLPIYIPFWQKRHPFLVPSIEKKSPFHYLLDRNKLLKQEVLLFSFEVCDKIKWRVACLLRTFNLLKWQTFLPFHIPQLLTSLHWAWSLKKVYRKWSIKGRYSNKHRTFNLPKIL